MKNGVRFRAWWTRILISLAYTLVSPMADMRADTVALWLFDEQIGIYPSCVLGDASSEDCPLVLGHGGQIVEGKFGNALEPLEQAPIQFFDEGITKRLAKWSGNTGPLALDHANFCALMTRGENHLRKEVGFASATRTRLNLGDFDWTVEFWYLPTSHASKQGVVFEVGVGPLGDKQPVTRFTLDPARGAFLLFNGSDRAPLVIPSEAAALTAKSANWHHFAFVYDSANQQLRHYVDGKQQALPEKFSLKSLEPSEDDYLSIGRDGDWNRPLPGRLDEMRFSDAQVYTKEFTPPGSFSQAKPSPGSYQLKAGLPLLFEGQSLSEDLVRLGNRKYVFIDDAIVAESENVDFHVNPPRQADRVLDGSYFGNHLVVFEDDDGLIRLYCKGPRNSLAVLTSRDGTNWHKPDLGREYQGWRNVVIEDPVGLGTIFLDPNAPREERIKYISGYRGRGFYVYSSPDGFRFTRCETSVLPFRAASQSIVFYDDQRRVYVGYHRSDMGRTVGGKNERTFVLTETTDVTRPWPFRPVSQQEQMAMGKKRRLKGVNPWYFDNGPLTPPGFGIEYPTVFAPDESLDPVGTDIYVPKCVKYPWATDTYLAFPLMYFHYHGEKPRERSILGDRERGRGSGSLETQLAVSRDGIHWRRYPRPAYIKIGRYGDLDLHKIYIAQGMVRRADEIWQYFLGSEQYHSAWTKKGKHDREAIFRVVQRLDGFVSADTPYTGGMLKTRTLEFEGNRLELNIDTGATGYAQVGLLDAKGKPIEGFGVDDCIYVNGDFIDAQVEWLEKGKDLSQLSGQPVRVVIRSRGTKLYSMQFVE